MTSAIHLALAILTAVAGLSAEPGHVLASSDPQVPCVEGQALDARRDPVIVWSQLPDLVEGSGHTSSLRLSDGYWAECADDFHLGHSASINSIEWWGTHGPPADLEYVIVRFYLDAPGSRPGAPGSLVYQESIYTLVGEQVTGTTGSDYRYTADLPLQFDASAGSTYWVSIQGVEQSSQWYWYDCLADDYWGEEGAFRSDYWGYPEWVPWSDFGPEAEEFAFVLYADSSPVEAAAWGAIKALFR